MKTLIRSFAMLTTLALSILNPLSTAHAQGTAFTYQGRLNLTGSPANGLYDFSFSLSSNPQGSIITASTGMLGVPVTNGLFTTVIDFGPSQFVGTSNWLQIAVRTNLTGLYTNLSPLTLITPTPYAIFANTASNLSGTVPAGHVSGTFGNGQLANSSVTVSAGTGLSGGGTVPLGGSTTLSNAGVLSVTGNADITATTVGGAVTLGDTATNTPVPNTLVKRDAKGGFFTTNLTVINALTVRSDQNGFHPMIDQSGDVPFIFSDTNYNFCAGEGAGQSLLGAPSFFNTAIGNSALLNARGSSSNNTVVGYAALALTLNTANNTVVGYNALSSSTTGGNNTALGYEALGWAGYIFNGGKTGGSNDIALGYAAGTNYTGNESYDIVIGSPGVAGENNTIRIGTPGTHTNTIIAGVVNDNGGVQVGTNGTVFATVQAGQAFMPAGGSVLTATNLIITFPQPFTSIPKIIVSAANDPVYQDVSDTFAVSVSSNSVSAFRVNVVRVDAPTGWSQQLRINWQAWQ